MSLILTVDADTRQATSKIKSASKSAATSVKNLETKAVSSASKIQSSFKTLAGIAGIGGVGFALRALTKQMTEFETALAEVSTLVDTSVVDMRSFNIEILKLTTGIPQDATQITKGLYQVISAGVTDASDALIVLEVAAKSATAGLTDTNVAVKAITSVLNAYELSAKDASGISDIFFETVRQGVTTFAELAPSLGRVTSIAAQVGVSFEEVTAGVAALTKAGLQTDNAIIALRQTLVSVLKPSSEAAILAEELGLNFNAEGLKAGGLGKLLDDLIQTTKGNSDAQAKLFGNVRALAGVMALTGSVSDDFTAILKNNKDAVGALDVATKKMIKTTASQAQLLKNKLNVDLLELGRVVLPVAVKGFNALLFAISPVNSMLNTYDEAVKNANKSTTEASKRNQEFLDIINGTTKAVEELNSVSSSAPETETPETLFSLKLKQDVEALEVKTRIREVSETELTLTLQALGVSRQTFELQRDVFLLAQDENLLAAATNTILNTRLEKVDEIALRESQAMIEAIRVKEESEKLADASERAADEAGRFAQNLARALATGKNLGQTIKGFIIDFGLTFLPGGRNFEGFAHGGIAPGGGVPSIVGEAGGAPEIIQSASPIRVTPLTTNNSSSRTVNNFNIVINDSTGNLRNLVRRQLIPEINSAFDSGQKIRTD